MRVADGLGDFFDRGAGNAKLDEMVGRAADWFSDHLGRISLGALAAHHVLRAELPGADGRHNAAKWQSRRSRRRFRWGRQPNGLWSPRSRHGSIESHHLVCGHVHALLVSHGCARRPQCGRRLVLAEILPPNPRTNSDSSRHPGASTTCTEKVSNSGLRLSLLLTLFRKLCSL